MALDSYTKLLMHMDDSSFIDVCGNTVTNNGATLDTTTKKFGNGSAYLSGTTATYLIAILDALNTTYTIDFWFNLRNNNGTNIFFTTNNVASTNASTTRYFGYKNGNFVIISNTDSQYYSFGAYSININQWYHCAYEWDGSNTTIYINGNNIKSVASNYLLRYFIKIGIDYYNYHYFNGNIDEFRISNIARWASNFIPPSFPYGISKYYLINDNSQYKYFNKTTFLMSNITNNPPTATDYRNYGNEQLDYLCTSYNQEVLQINNFVTLGSGKYGYVDCNDKFLDVKNDASSQNINLIPVMTNYTDATTGVNVLASNESSATNAVWKAFDNNIITTWLTSDLVYTGYAIINFNSTEHIINQYSITCSSTYNYAPCYWTFEYSNNGKFGHNGGVLNTDYFVADTQTIAINSGQWTSQQTKTFNLSNKINAQYFKLNITKNNGGRQIEIAEFKILGVNYKPYYLIQDNTTNEIYTYNGTTLIQSASQTINSSNFTTNGFNDLTVITNTMWTNIFSDITHARILYYSPETATIENDLTCDINSYKPIDDLQNQFTIDLFQDNS